MPAKSTKAAIIIKMILEIVVIRFLPPYYETLKEIILFVLLLIFYTGIILYIYIHVYILVV